jgi:hypothetical protein
MQKKNITAAYVKSIPQNSDPLLQALVNTVTSLWVPQKTENRQPSCKSFQPPEANQITNIQHTSSTYSAIWQ